MNKTNPAFTCIALLVSFSMLGMLGCSKRDSKNGNSGGPAQEAVTSDPNPFAGTYFVIHRDGSDDPSANYYCETAEIQGYSQNIMKITDQGEIYLYHPDRPLNNKLKFATIDRIGNVTANQELLDENDILYDTQLIRIDQKTLQANGTRIMGSGAGTMDHPEKLITNWTELADSEIREFLAKSPCPWSQPQAKNTIEPKPGSRPSQESNLVEH